MPGYNRAQLTAELTVVPSSAGRESPNTQDARRAATESRLAHESGPGSTILAGSRAQVLDAMRKVIEASLDAGAHIVQVKIETQGHAQRFHTG